MRVCARVLAAALMTGAIAGAFALPSLIGEGTEVPQALPAPPSVKLRTLHLPAVKAPAQHTIVVARRHVAQHATRPALIAARVAPAKVQRTELRIASAGRAGLPTRHPPPAPKPAPAPVPSPAPSAPPQRELAATAQPATTPAPAPPAAAGGDEGNGHGNGNANGHDKQAGDGGQAQNNGNGQANGNGQGNGDGKGNGHGK